MANERLIDANEVERKIRIAISSWRRDCNSNAPVIARAMEDALQRVIYAPTVNAVPVEQYKELMAEYNQLRENFVDFFCSGSMNPAPYCLNSCKECTDNRGWCDPSSDKCKGFNPADTII